MKRKDAQKEPPDKTEQLHKSKHDFSSLKILEISSILYNKKEEK